MLVRSIWIDIEFIWNSLKLVVRRITIRTLLNNKSVILVFFFVFNLFSQGDSSRRVFFSCIFTDCRCRLLYTPVTLWNEKKNTVFCYCFFFFWLNRSEKKMKKGKPKMIGFLIVAYAYSRFISTRFIKTKIYAFF